VRQHVGKELLLGAYDVIGNIGRLWRRETTSDTIACDTRATNTHQVVMIRESWIEAMVTKVELLGSRILKEVVLTSYAR